jgi:hypothetical protein
VSRLTTFTYTGILLGPALLGWVAGQIGLATTMDRIDAATAARRAGPAPAVAAEPAGGGAPGRVVMTTYQSAEDREFSAVILPGLIEGLVPFLV